MAIKGWQLPEAIKDKTTWVEQQIIKNLVDQGHLLIVNAPEDCSCRYSTLRAWNHKCPVHIDEWDKW